MQRVTCNKSQELKPEHQTQKENQQTSLRFLDAESQAAAAAYLHEKKMALEFKTVSEFKNLV